MHLNLRPLASIAGGIAGNALMPGLGGMALGSGLGRFLDSLGNGENIGQSAKEGALTGGLTYGGGKALGALRNAFAPSSSAAGPVGSEIGQGLPNASSAASAGASATTPPGLLSNAAGKFGGQWEPSAAATMTAPAAAEGGGGFLSMLGSGARNVGSFLKDNPNAAGGIFNGLGNMASLSSQNALRQAEAEQQAQQTRLLQQQEQAARSRSLAMEPLLRALMGSQGRIAPNPYSPLGVG